MTYNQVEMSGLHLLNHDTEIEMKIASSAESNNNNPLNDLLIKMQNLRAVLSNDLRFFSKYLYRELVQDLQL